MEQALELKIATINLRGLKQPGKREEVERWMTAQNIDILMAQETHISQNSREKKKDYTWYLNGNEAGEREFAGMAVVVTNKMHKYITDVIPHTNRMVELRLCGTTPVTILGIYAPQ